MPCSRHTSTTGVVVTIAARNSTHSSSTRAYSTLNRKVPGPQGLPNHQAGAAESSVRNGYLQQGDFPVAVP